MIPRLACIQAIRGFQAEKEISLSPTLTVIYGENGRGKTSLCEGWHWLFTGQMLRGLEPQSELGSAGCNIHVDLEPSMRLLDEGGKTIIERSGESYMNPGNLPSNTSPVLLQYRLHQILYASQADRRKFFEKVMELEIEAEFVQKLRRACQSIDPFTHQTWAAWERAIEAARIQDFTIPNTSPLNSQEQLENEQALLEFVGKYFGCESTPESIEQAMETGALEVDIPEEALAPPVSSDVVTAIEEAISVIDNLDVEAEQALERSVWRKRGLIFVEPPRCPFCYEETINKVVLDTIRRSTAQVERRHSAHREAKSKVEGGIVAVLPLVELDVESTRSYLQRIQSQIQELEIEESEGLLSKLADLNKALDCLEATRPTSEELKKPDVFGSFASAAIDVTNTWLALAPELGTVRKWLETRRIRVRYTEAAASILQYYRADRNEFFRTLDARPVLSEIADAAPKTVARLKAERLDRLAANIVRFYRILRPADPTPLEDIQAAGGVRGDIRILARSGDKVENASALFSYSNANALGMAAHIARVLDAQHRMVVLDDPFQSLDDSNRDYVIRKLITELLDDGLQVIVLTHERAAAQDLLDIYADRGALGTALRWDSAEGPIPEPMYCSGDAQLSMVLDGFERDDPSEIIKVANALRQLIEGFCADYLAAIGYELPESNRRNLGTYIAKLESLSIDLRPSQARLATLKAWNDTLSAEAHLAGSGAAGMDALISIAIDALQAQNQEKQLRPPDQHEWTNIPRSQGIKDRSRRILGVA